MAQLTVTTTPTRIDIDDTNNIAGTSAMYLCEDADLWLGRDADEATPANGFPLRAGLMFSEDTIGRDRLWASVATGTATVYVLRANV